MVQKRAMKITLPTKSYNDILEYFNLQTGLKPIQTGLRTLLFLSLLT